MTPNAKNAIHILEKLQEACSPAMLAFWALPNVVLTFSGARGYCDGVFWGDDAQLKQWDTEIAEGLEALQKITSVKGAVHGIQTVRGTEKCATFDVVLEGGLRYTLDHTNLLGKEKLKLIEDKDLSTEDMMKELMSLLQRQEAFRGYKQESLNDIAFGLLLGYPDDAISKSVLEWNNQDPFRERLIDADVRGADYYDCPQPVYSYPRHLVNDPKITAHEKLWTKILRDYYDSDFHKQLETNVDFTQKARDLGK